MSGAMLGPSSNTGMLILSRLVNLYETRGIQISTGLNPCHFDNYPLAPFTWFIQDGGSLTNGLGIALQEVYFLECLFARLRPERLFVVGNSLGWSTFALALLNPSARVFAIDAGFDRFSLDGLDFTNRVAAEEGLAITAVKAVSPGDVAPTLQANAMTPVDFAFIDGFHSVEQVQLDFDAIRPHAAPGCVYVFHDVEAAGLHLGIERIAEKSLLSWELLLGTTSGVAIMYDRNHRPTALDDIAAFVARPLAVKIVRNAAWDWRHRHLARWRRSLRKRLGGRAAR
jgi:predicted O-methyltransferase YrrM